jgi:signal transduction histidine kinase
MTAQNLSWMPQNWIETRNRYSKILQATNRLSLLLDRYLNEDSFTLIRRGVQYRPCNLHLMLEDAARSASILSSAHRFILQLDSLPENIVCDPDLMLLVLRSLADNAVSTRRPSQPSCLPAARRGITSISLSGITGPG